MAEFDIEPHKQMWRTFCKLTAASVLVVAFSTAVVVAIIVY